MTTTLVMIDDGVIAWKILACEYGSEGLAPPGQEPLSTFKSTDGETSCISGSGRVIAAALWAAGQPAYVYCGWGLRLEDAHVWPRGASGGAIAPPSPWAVARRRCSSSRAHPRPGVRRRQFRGVSVAVSASRDEYRSAPVSR